VISQGQIV